MEHRRAHSTSDLHKRKLGRSVSMVNNSSGVTMGEKYDGKGAMLLTADEFSGRKVDKSLVGSGVCEGTVLRYGFGIILRSVP